MAPENKTPEERIRFIAEIINYKIDEKRLKKDPVGVLKEMALKNNPDFGNANMPRPDFLAKNQIALEINQLRERISPEKPNKQHKDQFWGQQANSARASSESSFYKTSYEWHILQEKIKAEEAEARRRKKFEAEQHNAFSQGVSQATNSILNQTASRDPRAIKRTLEDNIRYSPNETPDEIKRKIDDFANKIIQNQHNEMAVRKNPKLGKILNSIGLTEPNTDVGKKNTERFKRSQDKTPVSVPNYGLGDTPSLIPKINGKKISYPIYNNGNEIGQTEEQDLNTFDAARAKRAWIAIGLMALLAAGSGVWACNAVSEVANSGLKQPNSYPTQKSYENPPISTPNWTNTTP